MIARVVPYVAETSCDGAVMGVVFSRQHLPLCASDLFLVDFERVAVGHVQLQK